MRFSRVALSACLVWAAGAVDTAQPAPGPLPDKVWRVGVFEAPPYAMRSENGEWRGLAIDLWKEIATELNLRYRLGEASPDTILDDIAQGRLDMAVAPFATTVARQQLFDFSLAFLSVETGIAARRGTDEDRWLTVARALATPSALRLYVAIAVLTFLAGAAIWLLEHRRNPQFSGGVLPGLGSGFWWSGVTTVGVGYGDKVPITFWGRIVGLIWMSISLVLVTALTAFVTAKLALAELGQVRGAASLRNAVVGTIEGSSAADFLRQEKIRRRVYATTPQALEALAKKQVDAVVYGADVLGYYTERDPQKRFEVLAGTFDHQDLAFPLPNGSPLREPINDALRRYMAQPGWRDLRDRFLGDAAVASGR
jgi:polar amino acid transport system substrate-binding protein